MCVIVGDGGMWASVGVRGSVGECMGAHDSFTHVHVHVDTHTCTCTQINLHMRSKIGSTWEGSCCTHPSVFSQGSAGLWK